MRARYGLISGAAVLLALVGCATFNAFTTDSHAPNRVITVDGMTDDWPGEMYVVPNERMMAGFQNDGSYLYVALVVEDAAQRFQIVSRGMTVWFDPKGGKEKAFGIRYPLGLPEKERKPARVDPKGEGLTMPDLPDGALSDLEIVRSVKEPPRRMPVADVKGLEIKVVPGTGLLVYEMKIPLAADAAHPIAVGAKPGSVVGIGFETDKPEAANLMRGDPGTDPAGGYGGGRGGGMGGRGGMSGGSGPGGRGGQMMSAEPVKIWAFVQLAPAKAPAPAPAASVEFRHD
jgi:hypothetical protein